MGISLRWTGRHKRVRVTCVTKSHKGFFLKNNNRTENTFVPLDVMPSLLLSTSVYDTIKKFDSRDILAPSALSFTLNSLSGLFLSCGKEKTKEKKESW